jgi:hypothetical protein
MKCRRRVPAVIGMLSIVITLTGCDYEFPAAKDTGIAIDRTLLGRWRGRETDRQGKETVHDLLVLPFSESEYLVEYPAGPDALFCRAYHIKLGTVKAVQLQVIGTRDGPIQDRDAALYMVLDYELRDGKLVVRKLNKDALGAAPVSGTELTAAIQSVADHPELFHEPMTFERVAATK